MEEGWSDSNHSTTLEERAENLSNLLDTRTDERNLWRKIALTLVISWMLFFFFTL